jgi:hypothetical protein
MAISHYGVNATLASNTTPSLKVRSKHRHGRVRISYDEYEASSVAVGSQIAMGWVPAGATLLSARLKFDALGAGTTLCVGDQFDCDRFIATVVTVNAGDVGGCGVDLIIGAVNLTSTLGLHGTGMGYEFQCDTDILVTVPYAGGAITGTVKLQVFYSTD